MARIGIHQFSVEIVNRSEVQVSASYSVAPTDAEAELGVPLHVWFRLMGQGYAQGEKAVADDWRRFRTWADHHNPAPGWVYVGWFIGAANGGFRRTLHRDEIPGADGNDQYFLVTVTYPEILAGIEYAYDYAAGAEAHPPLMPAMTPYGQPAGAPG